MSALAPISWKSTPETAKFADGFDYLDLLFEPEVARDIVLRLVDAATVTKRANDILRAAQLPILGVEDDTVAALISKAADGKRWSPVFLVRGRPLIVADGYHRICAAYAIAEHSPVACRIA